MLVCHEAMKTCFAIRWLALVAMLALLFAGGCKQKNDVMDDLAKGDSDDAGDMVPLDPSVTRELFLNWRSPRVGTSNPERMNNPVWEWLVKCRISAYQATERLKGPSAMQAGPGWCFD